MQVRLKYVKRKRNKNGTDRYYWDRPGFKQVRLPDDPDSRALEALQLNKDAEAGTSEYKVEIALPDELREELFAYWIAHYRGAKSKDKRAQEKHPQSEAWKRLARATQENYLRELEPIVKRFGDLPVTSITRRVIKHYLDTLPVSRRSTALSVLKNVLGMAYDYGATDTLATLEMRTERPPARSDVIWSDDDIDRFLEEAPRVVTKAYPQLITGFLLALHTGQREGDVLKMKWSDFDGTFLHVLQDKTKAKNKNNRKVYIYADREIIDVLDRARHRNQERSVASTHIVHMMDGRQYNRHAFWRLFERVREAAGLKHLRFHDLRRTAATRLALAGNDVTRICSITGHSAQTVTTLVDVYISERQALSKQAMEAKERYRVQLLQNVT